MKKTLISMISLVVLLSLLTGCAANSPPKSSETDDLKVILLIPGTLGGDKSFF